MAAALALKALALMIIFIQIYFRKKKNWYLSKTQLEEIVFCLLPFWNVKTTDDDKQKIYIPINADYIRFCKHLEMQKEVLF